MADAFNVLAKLALPTFKISEIKLFETVIEFPEVNLMPHAPWPVLLLRTVVILLFDIVPDVAPPAASMAATDATQPPNACRKICGCAGPIFIIRSFNAPVVRKINLLPICIVY